MNVLTYTSYKEHCDLYTEIHGSIAGNSCQIELVQNDIILPSKVSIVIYKAVKRTSVENTKFIIRLNLSADTYSIDSFNAKIKVMQSYNKGKTGNHLKLKIEDCSTKRLHIHGLQYYFYWAWRARQLS